MEEFNYAIHQARPHYLRLVLGDPKTVLQPLLINDGFLWAAQTYTYLARPTDRARCMEVIRILHEEYGACVDNIGGGTCALIEAAGRNHNHPGLPELVDYLIDHGATRGGDDIEWIAALKKQRDTAHAIRDGATIALMHCLGRRQLGIPRDIVRLVGMTLHRNGEWQDWKRAAAAKRAKENE